MESRTQNDTSGMNAVVQIPETPELSSEPVQEDAYTHRLQNKEKNPLYKMNFTKGGFVMGDYNGWANRATWNIALWINNDEGIYKTVRNYVKKRKDCGKRVSYTDMIQCTGLYGCKTPDRFSFSSKNLNRRELTDMLNEMYKEA